MPGKKKVTGERRKRNPYKFYLKQIQRMLLDFAGIILLASHVVGLLLMELNKLARNTLL